MKEIIEEFVRAVIVILTGYIVLSMLSLNIIDNQNLKHEIGIEGPIQTKGYIQATEISKNYEFNVVETIDKCLNDEFTPDEYASASLNGNDLSSYIVVQNMPNMSEPGTYEVEYILVFEGERVKKILTVNVQDNSVNVACPVWDSGPRACSLNSDCPDDMECSGPQGDMHCSVVE